MEKLNMNTTWEIVKLDRFFVIKKGQTITKKDSNPGIYPVILGGREPAYYIDKYNHTGKAIVVSRSGASAGYVSFWNEPIFVTDGFLIEPKDDVNYEFVYYLLKLKQSQLLGSQRGAAIPHVTPNLLYNVQAFFPPLPTQKQIASILSAYDNLIENNNKRIKILEQMAENLYKEWFVRFRFPGHETTPLENGIPKGWSEEKLSAVFEVKYGKDHKNIEDGLIPIFGSGGIMRYGNKALCSEESVLIPRKGSLNNVMYYKGDFWTVDTMFYTKMKIKHCAKYTYFTLSKVDLEGLNSGASIPSMTTDILYHLKMIVPDESTLITFDKQIDLLFAEKDSLELQNQNLIKQRDLLLPRLMSGKL